MARAWWRWPFRCPPQTRQGHRVGTVAIGRRPVDFGGHRWPPRRAEGFCKVAKTVSARGFPGNIARGRFFGAVSVASSSAPGHRHGGGGGGGGGQATAPGGLVSHSRGRWPCRWPMPPTSDTASRKAIQGLTSVTGAEARTLGAEEECNGLRPRPSHRIAVARTGAVAEAVAVTRWPWTRSGKRRRPEPRSCRWPSRWPHRSGGASG
jgi:hypothetical protein